MARGDPPACIRHDDGQEELEDHETAVASESALGWESIVAYVGTHALEEGPDVVDRVGMTSLPS